MRGKRPQEQTNIRNGLLSQLNSGLPLNSNYSNLDPEDSENLNVISDPPNLKQGQSISNLNDSNNPYPNSDLIQNKQLIQIIKRPDVSTKLDPITPPNEPKILQPIKSFHQRQTEYYAARERIFGSPKISPRIARIRNQKKNKKKALKYIEATTLFCSDDDRPYANVKIFGESMFGLLDSGASISCLGVDGEEFLRKLNIPYDRFSSHVRTADGNSQPIIGKFLADITYKNETKKIEMYVVPSLQQKLYLGINFWKSFGIAPQIISEISQPINVSSEMRELSGEEFSKLQTTISMFPSFATLGLGKTMLEEHEIDTGDAEPIKQRHYPVSPAVQKQLYEELDRLLEMGIIEVSNSPWSSPVVLVRKPGKNRMCLDYRKVNQVTKKSAYPLPHIQALLSRISDTRYISSVDLKDAFLQIPLEKSSREKTAFTVPGRPLYQFKVMPFGLCNAPQRLCKLMDKVVPHELKENVFVYLDDLLIVSSNFEDHIRYLKIVAENLKNAGLTINLEKSKFCFKELKYLGYIIGDGLLKTDPAKVAAIKDFPIPQNQRQVRRFLGMSGWYRRFVRDYSSLATPITETLKKNRKFEFGNEAIDSCQKIKDILTSEPVLVHPDYSKPFIILCDASSTGIGGVLCQKDDEGIERPIYYYSHKLNKAQCNYSVTERECLAAVLSIEQFRPYVEGYHFKVVTDHASLKWLMNQKDLSGRLARWSLKLQGYDFDIEHRKGSQHVVPDALSRVYATDELDPCCVSELYPSDVLHIDQNDPSFKSAEYIQIIDNITKQKDQLPDLQVSENFVYKKVKHSTGNPLEDDLSWKLWIPSQLTDRLISLAHQPPRASHGGLGKTLHRLRQQFFWPNMASHVKSFVGSCEVCKMSKASNQVQRQPMGKPFVVERPFQHIVMDFLGPYPRSKNGNAFIIIALDQLTKFVILKGLRKATAETATKFLNEEILCVFGVPESVLTDNGKQFTSSVFKKLLTSYGIQHIRTASYAPQANASERVNRSILAAIRSYLGKDQRDWDVNLPTIACALRTATHSAIGMSPYEALFGQKMIEHGSDFSLLRKLDCVNNSELNVIPKSSKMNIIHNAIKDSLEKAHLRYEHTYNTRSKDIKYNVGDVVFKRNFVLSDATKKINAKLCPKFIKAKIVNIVGNNLYELVDENGKSIGVFHSKDIKK